MKHLNLTSITTAALLMSTAQAQVYKDGLLNSPLGQAGVSLGAAGELVVDNLGSSGLDGVRVSIPCALGAAVSLDVDLGVDGLGAFSVDVVQEGIPGTAQASLGFSTGPGGSDLFVRPDFSAFGQQSYGLRLIKDGQVVAELVDQMGPTKMSNVPFDWPAEELYAFEGDIEPGTATDQQGLLFCYVDENATVTPPGGNPIEADVVEFLSAQLPQANPITELSAARLTFEGPSQFSITSEKMRHYDLWMQGLDAAHLDTDSAGRLKVSNLGSSGCDGVSIAIPDDTDQINGEVAELAAPNHMGGEVTLETTSRTGGEDKVHCTEIGGEWLMTPSFRGIGSSGYDLFLSFQGQTVFSDDDRNGPAVAMAAWSLFYKKTTTHPDGTTTVEWCIGGTSATSIQVQGGPAVMADMVTLRSKPIDVLHGEVTALRLRGGNLSTDMTVASVATRDTCVGSNYCVAAINSSGQSAVMCATGSASVAANDLALSCSGLPENVFGLLFYSQNQGFSPFGDGWLCLSGPFTRMVIFSSDANGMMNYAVDNTSPPNPAGQILAGQVYNFQCWYRDSMGAGSGFNLSNGLSIEFDL